MISFGDDVGDDYDNDGDDDNGYDDGDDDDGIDALTPRSGTRPSSSKLRYFACDTNQASAGDASDECRKSVLEKGTRRPGTLQLNLKQKTNAACTPNYFFTGGGTTRNCGPVCRNTTTVVGYPSLHQGSAHCSQHLVVARRYFRRRLFAGSNLPTPEPPETNGPNQIVGYIERHMYWMVVTLNSTIFDAKAISLRMKQSEKHTHKTAD